MPLEFKETSAQADSFYLSLLGIEQKIKGILDLWKREKTLAGSVLSALTQRVTA